MQRQGLSVVFSLLLLATPKLGAAGPLKVVIHTQPVSPLMGPGLSALAAMSAHSAQPPAPAELDIAAALGLVPNMEHSATAPAIFEALSDGTQAVEEGFHSGHEAETRAAVGALFGETISAGANSVSESAFIAQGLSLTQPVQLHALSAEHREAIYRAADALSSIISQNADSLSAEGHSLAKRIDDRLIEVLLDESPSSPLSIVGYNAPILTSEDYRLGFSSPRQIGLASEVVEALKNEPGLLAEYLFHAVWASLEPVRSKNDSRARYLGVQRALFGQDNELGIRLRTLIDRSAPAEQDLGQRGGTLVPHAEQFRDYMLDALLLYYEGPGRVKRHIDEEYAELAANSLARMYDGTIAKLFSWNVIDEREMDIILHQALYSPMSERMQTLAGKIVGLLQTYEEHGFSPAEIKNISTRLPPYPVFQAIQRDTGINRSLAAEMLGSHKDFDTYIYRAHSVVERIAGDVNGANNAWTIVINHGIEQAPAWVNLAKPLVQQLKEAGCPDAWSYVAESSLPKIRRKILLLHASGANARTCH